MTVDAGVAQRIASFEQMIANGRDDALVRYSLGLAYAQSDNPEQAAEQFRIAIERKPDYSAAYRQLGEALAEVGLPDEAIDAYRSGIKMAERAGDVQAVRQMQVFVKRLEKERQRS